jgi:hypothetical protein
MEKFRTLISSKLADNIMALTEFLLTLALTVVLTAIIVMGANWIKKNRQKHPRLYKSRGVIGALVYLILSSGDLR